MDTKETTKLNKEEFNNILSKLENLAASIEVITNVVMNKDLLLKRGTKFIDASLKSLSKLNSDSDMAMTDYYHILAMTELTTVEILELTLGLKKLLDARNNAKHCSLILNQFKTLLCSMNSNKSSYKTKVLCENKELTVKF